MILDHTFFDRYPLRLAPVLLGKVLRDIDTRTREEIRGPLNSKAN
jgi:hypothetical protein